MFIIVVLSLSVLVSAAQVDACGWDGGGMGGGGMGGGMMMGEMGSSIVVADDGSLLITEMGMGMMGGWGSSQAALINISADGDERWQVPFNNAWPMMPVTDGDLVVVVVSSGGWGMWGGQTSQSWIYGVDLATGNQRWQINLNGGMASFPQFSDDGSRIYLTAWTYDGNTGSDPMGQGGWNSGMSGTLMAIDRTGDLLWQRELGN
jgi:hypothetical protein